MRIFFNKTYTLKRLTDSNDKESYTQIGSIEGGIYSLSSDDIILSEGDPVTGAVLYVDNDVDIKVTDKVIDENSNEWIVKSVKNPNAVVGYSYKRCIINLPNS